MSESERSPSYISAAMSPVEDTMEQFLSAANVNAVYGVPVEQGGQLIIPSAEVLSIAGFGIGYGGGTDASGENPSSGEGGGGGGGGRVLSRPVAVVVATNDRVQIKPVIDITKVVLAWITALGFVFATMMRMRRGDFE